MLGITLKETRVYREIKQEGREEGELSPQIRSSVENLSLEQLENLGVDAKWLLVE